MLWELIKGGVVALKDYIALHLITCLVPAFFIAGAIGYSARLLGIDLGISRAIGAIIFSIVIGLIMATFTGMLFGVIAG